MTIMTEKLDNAVGGGTFGVQPLFQYIAVRVDEKPKERNGVFLPATIDKRMETGIVLAVGEGRILQTGEALSASEAG